MYALAAAYSASVVASAPHVVNHLPMPAWAYGAIALGVGVLLLVFTWMFRHTAAVLIDGPQAGHGSASAGGQGHGHGGEH